MFFDEIKLDDIVNIFCNDEEMFPVRKKLLTPCIKLTSVVASGLGKYRVKNGQVQGDQSSNEGPVETKVDIDCLTFDRCLLYLESECRGKGEDHDFEAVYNEDMLDAAKKLGCRVPFKLSKPTEGLSVMTGYLVSSVLMRYSVVLARNF